MCIITLILTLRAAMSVAEFPVLAFPAGLGFNIRFVSFSGGSEFGAGVALEHYCCHQFINLERVWRHGATDFAL